MAPSAVTITSAEPVPVQGSIHIKSASSNGGELSKNEKTPLEMISQGVSLPGVPTFVSFAQQRQWMLEHMALAFRVFARKGYTEGMSGHISVRDPEHPHTFWTNPLGRHFGMLKASDMILVDYDGNAIGGNMSRPANAAGFLIHSAVHKARPDVVSIKAVLIGRSSPINLTIRDRSQHVTLIALPERPGRHLPGPLRC